MGREGPHRRALQAKKQNPDDPPVLRQCFTTDSTLESLATVLKQNLRGMVFVRDELTGWAQAMDQYRNGKGADREAWLSIWSSTALVINRKNLPEPIFIVRPFVSVTGYSGSIGGCSLSLNSSNTSQLEKNEETLAGQSATLRDLD